MVDRYGGKAMMRNKETLSHSCMGENVNISDCQKLKNSLKLVDFSLIDTVLYLDVYPESAEALSYYHKLKKEREMLVDALSKSCKSPITIYENESSDEWTWSKGPWPWEPSAN